MNAPETVPALASPGGSWRDIRQEVRPVAMSRKGRRRQIVAWVKVGSLIAGIMVGGWGAIAVVHSWVTDRTALASAVHSPPVRSVVLITNGVLPQEWVSGRLALPPSATLVGLDLPALRDRLLGFGQVRSAVLTRNFPDTLVVKLEERTPVARVSADTGTGSPQQLLVAPDGVVYDGLNYDQAMLATLPWLDGVRLVRAGSGLAPIPDMTDVAALLTKAQLEASHLYQDWLVVSLAHLGDRDEIVVSARDKVEITFSRKRDYFQQLALLDAVVEKVAARAEPVRLQTINLTLGAQVPVQLSGTPDELAAPPGSSVSTSTPTPQRKSQRDL